ncbi:LPXTG cell wall anchor domain-containing protein [Romboutsia weinsteinii]|uniref:LPXTG cell wall anchor domain-containing protein n=2 Tax=Romboutsia weinsteinii TaxID=2020949 RepID=A0A371JA29_9FIRM|nr:LPXTG cell wall anchor domain-containing protein [Romboutsia weinsteinii]
MCKTFIYWGRKMKKSSRILSTGMATLMLSSSVLTNTVIAAPAKGEDIVKVSVFSDPHLLPEEFIGNKGNNYQDYVAGDRKMLAESERILDAAIDNILKSDSEIVIVPGDLTKDGERESHELFASKIKKLEDAGKEVFVINGNHDINMPDGVSVKFVADGVDENGNPKDKVENVDSILPGEFKEIYKDFGYEQALAQDPNSLSYVAKLKDGYRLIAIDAAVYGETKEEAYKQQTGGVIEEDTLKWVLKQVEEAKKAGDEIIGMMHYGLLEHFEGQATVFSPYVVENYKNASTKLADAGMNYVFTGHFHAQDIVQSEKTANGNTIIDIETGSLSTSPSPYREVEIDKRIDKIKIESKFIESIEGIENFREYANKFLEDGIPSMVSGLLIDVVEGLLGGDSISNTYGLENLINNNNIDEIKENTKKAYKEILKERSDEENSIDDVEEKIENTSEEIQEESNINESNQEVEVNSQESSLEENLTDDNNNEYLYIDKSNKAIEEVFTKTNIKNWLTKSIKELETASINDNWKLMDAVTYCLKQVYKGDEVYSDEIKALQNDMLNSDITGKMLATVLKKNLKELQGPNPVENVVIQGAVGMAVDDLLKEGDLESTIATTLSGFITSLLTDYQPGDNNIKLYDGNELTAKYVVDYIEKLPSKITLSNREKVEIARLLYEELNEQDKKSVTNINKLVKLEQDLAKLDERGLRFLHLSSYSTGLSSEDGGVAEIVKYNKDNQKMYLVNGATKTIDIVKINKDGSTKKDKSLDVSNMIKDFKFGDITSVDINTKQKLVAVSVQEEDYTKSGAVLLLDYDGNLVKSISVGIQPDMVTFTEDGNHIITADEGEPREGYGDSKVDPKGSVSIINFKNGVDKAKANIVDFTKFDSKKDELIANKVLLNKNTNPSVDLEPEYITLSSDGKKAYVALQEANAIATLDIENQEFTSIKGLGFKDHSKEANALDAIKDGKINIKTQNLQGIYMPDGLASYDVNGKTYILTPNEGDSREWGDYSNVSKVKIDGKNVEVLDTSKQDGVDEDVNYLFGGRSFSIWDADTMTQIFDSGSDFETITSDLYPEYFNSSHKELELDNRSGKKGPEPEDIKVGEIDGETYAFVGLERIGGIMSYNITDPQNTFFVDYINTRDFSGNMQGDLGVEGLNFISESDSPTGKPMLLAANEVSGTVSLFGLSKNTIVGDEETPSDNPENPGQDEEQEPGAGQDTTSRPNESQGNKLSDNTTTSPQTGDSSLFGLSVVGIAAVAGFVVNTFKKKK